MTKLTIRTISLLDIALTGNMTFDSATNMYYIQGQSFPGEIVVKIEEVKDTRVRVDQKTGLNIDIN